jgi:hypothetical protein
VWGISNEGLPLWFHAVSAAAFLFSLPTHAV